MNYFNFLVKTSLTVFIVLVGASSLHSQSNADLHTKYWFYKTRFNNDFVKIGLNAGESLPFNQNFLIHENN